MGSIHLMLQAALGFSPLSPLLLLVSYPLSPLTPVISYPLLVWTKEKKVASLVALPLVFVSFFCVLNSQT